MPPGVVNIIFGTGPTAGDALVGHPDVPLISFTGSTVTAQRITERSAPFCKKLSLELGGKNPAIIFADADLEQCIETTVRSSFSNQVLTVSFGTVVALWCSSTWGSSLHKYEHNLMNSFGLKVWLFLFRVKSACAPVGFLWRGVYTPLFWKSLWLLLKSGRQVCPQTPAITMEHWSAKNTWRRLEHKAIYYFTWSSFK